MKTRPVDIYVRVSRRGDREDGRYHTKEEQAERARAHAEARGYVVGRVFTDENVSGGIHPNERPKMRKLLDQIRAGKSGGVVAFSLDRLSRHPAHGDWLVQEITKAGGVVTAPDIPDDITTPTGEFTFGMLLGVARLYRRQAGARIDSAKERAIEAGVPVGPIAFGFRPRVPKPEGRDTRTLEERAIEVDPDTAPIIRELFERRAREVGLSALARYLSEQTAREWTKQAVASILRNRVYIGELRWGPYVNRDPAREIIDEPLWLAIQKTHSRPTARRGTTPWLLSGLARCAECGYALAPWTPSAKSKWPPKPRYRCPRGHVSIRAVDLEQAVVNRYFETPTVLRIVGQAPDLDALEADLAAAERRLDQALSEEFQEAAGNRWTAVVAERRNACDAAAEALGKARAATEPVDDELQDLEELWRAEGLLDVGDEQFADGTPGRRARGLGITERRKLLAWRFGVIAVHPDRSIETLPPSAAADWSKRRKPNDPRWAKRRRR